MASLVSPFSNAFLPSCRSHLDLPKGNFYDLIRNNGKLLSRLCSGGNLDNEDESSLLFSMHELSSRIQRVREDETKASDTFAQVISQRLEELKSSQLFEYQLKEMDKVSVPVICFDALLPRQKLEGRLSVFFCEKLA